MKKLWVLEKVRKIDGEILVTVQTFESKPSKYTYIIFM